MRFDTLAIHAGQQPEPTTGAIMTPVFLSSTYVQAGPGEHKGYEYSRTRNPTRTALEACLAALEGAKHGFAFASGCAAADCLMHLLDAGDHVVCSDDVYGGTFRLFDKVFKRQGLTFQLCGLESARSPRRGADAEDEAGVGRDAHQPHAEAGGLGQRLRGGPQARRPQRLRQHLHVPLLPASAGARHGRRPAFDDQVPQRPQ